MFVNKSLQDNAIPAPVLLIQSAPRLTPSLGTDAAPYWAACVMEDIYEQDYWN